MPWPQRNNREVVWGALLVLAMLAARFVPGLAVDVPDQLLIDIGSAVTRPTTDSHLTEAACA